MKTTIAVLSILATSMLTFGSESPVTFQSAKPIWPEGREKEKNLFVGFHAGFAKPAGGKAVLRLAASTEYRAFLNGKFLAQGPARGPHGFYRVDELPLTPLKSGQNVIAIEVAGYNVNSFALLDQPSFLQAEVAAGDRVLCSTGAKDAAFRATVLKERVQKVQRYSFQRPFSEAYCLTPSADRWRSDAKPSFEEAKCAVMEAKQLLPRRVPLPGFAARAPVALIASGKLEGGAKPAKLWKDRSLTGIGPKLGGYLENELETTPSIELQSFRNASVTQINKPYSSKSALPLRANDFNIIDLGCNLTGFIGAKVKVGSHARLFFTFDEILSPDVDVDFRRMGCVNIVSYDLQPGSYELESFEPYTMRYLKVLALEGDCQIQSLYLRELVNPDAVKAKFACSDKNLNRIFEAARETFRQNATDVFMDCPSRERAGWLCDSYFTARVAKDLCGDTSIEKNFYEAFLLPPTFEHLPDGMLPMCYPSDHFNGQYIPNWAMWFVVELEEYYARSGDRAMVDSLKPRVLKLIEFFKQYRNSDGLLEKLQSWVFVEWSMANKFVQDVNYPSNMLYAKVLDVAARLYDMPELAREATQMREVIRKQSFDGEFFVDNALRKAGKLEVTQNHSEVCQYFAFFFDVATPTSHPKLWQALAQEFGPKRKETKAFPQVHPANAFIGNQLRFELLSRYGRGQQILDEAAGYWLYMVDRTGTLWENDTPTASCNHGFASHAAHVCLRDVLGLYDVDTIHKTLKVRFLDIKLESCKGSIPTPDGAITMRWKKDGSKLAYHLDTPAGYKVEIKNESGREVVQQR